jgi:hypothetical protein
MWRRHKMPLVRRRHEITMWLRIVGRSATIRSMSRSGEIGAMSFVKGLLATSAVIALSLAGSALAQDRSSYKTQQQLAQLKGKAPAGGVVVENGPSNVDLINKALKPGASDPDVPLPRADLPKSPSPGQPLFTGPHMYGRSEQGGTMLGYRMPIPADRSGSAASTRYSPEYLLPQSPLPQSPPESR